MAREADGSAGVAAEAKDRDPVRQKIRTNPRRAEPAEDMQNMDEAEGAGNDCDA